MEQQYLKATDLHPIRREALAGHPDAQDIIEYGPVSGDTYAAYLTGSAWQQFRRAVFARQGGECATCPKEATHCHHRTYARCGFERDNDCVGLCAECHAKLHV